MRWPFAQWGASLIISGHQHAYERLVIREGSSHRINYIVNGLGGHPWLYDIDSSRCQPPEQGSQVRYSNEHGFMIGSISHEFIETCFYSTENGGSLIDHFFISSNEKSFS
jgi:tartrate-resistant acid phosphatase type 5